MDNKVITSVNNSLIKDVVKLKDKKEILTKGLIILEGKNNIEIAKKNNLIQYIFTSDTSLEGRDVIYVADNVLRKISNFKNHQDTIAVSRVPTFERKQFNKVIVLEDIQDPGNLGTIIRSALAFGFDAVVISKQSCFKYNDKIINSSQGAIFDIPIFQEDIKKFFETFDYKIVSTSLDSDSLSIKEVSIEGDYALVFGNEGRGISNDVLENTDVKVIIPIDGIDSLNVSIAASIAMYELNGGK